MKVWVLTREINQYDQDGAYFVEIFKDFPTKEKLLKVGVYEDNADRLLHGENGRRNGEDEWWYLEEMKAQ